MPLEWQEITYPLLKLTEINIEYNGGLKLHQQYKDVITHITKQTKSKSTYGAQLFLYMVEICRQRNSKGFKVSLDKSLFVSKKTETSYVSWVDTLQYMVDIGYGKLYIGDSHKTEGRVEYVTVFSLSTKAFTLTKSKNLTKAPTARFKVGKTTSVVTTMKYTKGKHKLEDEITTGGSRPYKNFVNEINQHNLKHTFTTGCGVSFDPQLQRKFSLYKDEKKNNNLTMWESYGRYHGEFQSMSPLDRSMVEIDGEATVEGDYSSNHAFIAYEKLGIVCKDDFRHYGCYRCTGKTYL